MSADPNRDERAAHETAGIEARMTLAWISANSFGDDPAQALPPTSLARLALSAADGQADATRLLVAIGEAGAPVDALFEALEKLRALNDLARMKAFLRVIQDRIGGRS